MPRWVYSVSVTSDLLFPALGWQLADSSALRSSPNIWGVRSGLSDVFACRASRSAGWHNCFRLSPTTGDLVLALCVLPLFLHAQAVARSMPEPSLGAPVPSRSLSSVELFDRVARPWASVSRLVRIAPSASRFRRCSTSPPRVWPSDRHVGVVVPIEGRYPSGMGRVVVAPSAAGRQGDDLEETVSIDQPRPLARESHVDFQR